MSKNLLFVNEMKNLFNEKVREIYADTEYWGKEKRREGVVNPVNECDRKGWSNVNFINTNISAYKVIERHMIKSLTRDINCDRYLNLNKSSSEHKYNFYLLKYVEKHAETLLSPGSECLNEIIDVINKTRNWGEDAENKAQYVLTKMNKKIEKVSGDGEVEDFKGIDCLIDGKTAQIKKCKSVIVDKETQRYYFVRVPNPNRVTQDHLVLVSYEAAKAPNPFLLVYLFDNEIHEKYKTPAFIHPDHPLYKKINTREELGYYLPIESLKILYKADLRGDDIIRVKPIG